MNVTIPPPKEPVTLHGMDQQYRILHYILVHSLKPRKHNLSTIMTYDVKDINNILNSPSINWSRLVLHNMIECRDDPKALLIYPFLVMGILEDEQFNLRDGNIINETKHWEITNNTFKGTLGQINAPPRPIPQRPSPPLIPYLDPSKATTKELATAMNYIMKEQAEIKAILRRQFKLPEDVGRAHGEGSSHSAQAGDEGQDDQGDGQNQEEGNEDFIADIDFD